MQYTVLRKIVRITTHGPPLFLCLLQICFFTSKRHLIISAYCRPSSLVVTLSTFIGRKTWTQVKYQRQKEHSNRSKDKSYQSVNWRKETLTFQEIYSDWVGSTNAYTTKKYVWHGKTIQTNNTNTSDIKALAYRIETFRCIATGVDKRFLVNKGSVA